MSTNAKKTEFLTIADFARLSTLSESTVRRRIQDGSLQYFQPGGPRTRVFLSADALSASREEMGTEQAAEPLPDWQKASSEKTQPLERLPGPMPRWARSGPRRRS
jgi:hypothetical protein